MFRQFSPALVPLTKAVPMALGWQWNVTAVPGHRELAAAAEIVLGFFGREQLVSFTLCLKCGSGHAPSPSCGCAQCGQGAAGTFVTELTLQRPCSH